ncbi:thioredoxin domain-containing protein [Agreia pratensis]|uniref:DsbA family protein n=1 Tax=Agreia pratensis TaxID=150121 RepID=UPI00188B23EF|nr:DsbA family protein [Agreia pratensis]MBF4632819.1 thioredoxin domain-containing protein [Agreia pratensis]
MNPKRLLPIAAVLIAASLVVGCSTEPQKAPSASALPTPSASVAVPTGTVGAAHLDDGFVQIGTGPKVVDLFVDPLCPYCKLFEETSGELLFSEAATGRATLRVHPLAILNRLSQGTNYSTRAAAMFVAVAAESPDAAQAYLQALFEEQPAENTRGLTDARLQEIASTVGASPITDDVAGYQAWVDTWSLNAVTGPLDATTEITTISHVPTIIVSGAVFPGNSDETDAFAAFYASAGL